jgi:hypothetical protein
MWIHADWIRYSFFFSSSALSETIIMHASHIKSRGERRWERIDKRHWGGHRRGAFEWKVFPPFHGKLCEMKSDCNRVSVCIWIFHIFLLVCAREEAEEMKISSFPVGDCISDSITFCSVSSWRSSSSHHDEFIQKFSFPSKRGGGICMRSSST